MKTIIMKIGGSVITKKNSDKPIQRTYELKRIAKEISEAYEQRNFNLILIHGVGSYGHPIVKKHNLQNGMITDEQKHAFTQTQLQVNELNSIVTKALMDEGIKVKPIDASSSAVMERGELISMSLEPIESALENKMVPVLYGVPVYDTFRNCSILSGDRILSYLANKFNPNLIIHGTDTDGIYTDDPKKNSEAYLIKKISGKDFSQIENYLKGSSNTDVTGGMKTKVEELMSLDSNSEIVNGLKPGLIKRVLMGEKNLGTSIEISDKVECDIPLLSKIKKMGKKMGRRAQDRNPLLKIYFKICKFLGLK